MLLAGIHIARLCFIRRAHAVYFILLKKSFPFLFRRYILNIEYLDLGFPIALPTAKEVKSMLTMPVIIADTTKATSHLVNSLDCI